MNSIEKGNKDLPHGTVMCYDSTVSQPNGWLLASSLKGEIKALTANQK